MTLTSYQEAELMQKYDKVVWKIVHRFKRTAASTNWNNKDDLYQEGMMVLLRHIRKAENQEELDKLPVMDIWNAMVRHVMGEQVVSIPKRTTDYRKSIAAIAETIEYGELETAEDSGNEIGEAEERIAMEQFANSLPELDRNIVLLKMKGHNQAEVSKILGVPPCKVTRHLRKIQEIYFDQKQAA